MDDLVFYPIYGKDGNVNPLGYNAEVTVVSPVDRRTYYKYSGYIDSFLDFLGIDGKLRMDVKLEALRIIGDAGLKSTSYPSLIALAATYLALRRYGYVVLPKDVHEYLGVDLKNCRQILQKYIAKITRRLPDVGKVVRRVDIVGTIMARAGINDSTIYYYANKIFFKYFLDKSFGNAIIAIWMASIISCKQMPKSKLERAIGVSYQSTRRSLVRFLKRHDVRYVIVRPEGIGTIYSFRKQSEDPKRKFTLYYTPCQFGMPLLVEFKDDGIEVKIDMTKEVDE